MRLTIAFADRTRVNTGMHLSQQSITRIGSIRVTGINLVVAMQQLHTNSTHQCCRCNRMSPLNTRIVTPTMHSKNIWQTLTSGRGLSRHCSQSARMIFTYFDSIKSMNAIILFYKCWNRSGTANAEQSRNPSNESPPLKSKSSKLHTIYPAIEKRNKRSASMTWQERFFLDHHRSTRHELYEIIEKYLSAWVCIRSADYGEYEYRFFLSSSLFDYRKGYNGTACVLKTLCEVGKKQSDSEPSTFLAEIVRVVFR